MNELALFAGAGGGLLGSRLLGWRTVCYVEREPYPVDVLKARIRDGYLDDAPIWDDVRTFDGHPWAGSVDIVTAGFPCQPFSGAGRGGGENDERNLWPATARVIGEVRPRFVLLENVSRLLAYTYYGNILAALSGMGYDNRWGTFQGTTVGSPQQRKRIFAVANADGFGLHPDAVYTGIVGKTQKQEKQAWWIGRTCHADDGTLWRVPDFEFSGVVDGDAHWMDRVRAIGNGQIPAVVRMAWNELSGGGE